MLLQQLNKLSVIGYAIKKEFEHFCHVPSSQKRTALLPERMHVHVHTHAHTFAYTHPRSAGRKMKGELLWHALTFRAGVRYTVANLS